MRRWFGMPVRTVNALALTVTLVLFDLITYASPHEWRADKKHIEQTWKRVWRGM
jgi:hypothetical protein